MMQGQMLDVMYHRNMPKEFQLRQTAVGNWIDVRVDAVKINGEAVGWKPAILVSRDPEGKNVVAIHWGSQKFPRGQYPKEYTMRKVEAQYYNAGDKVECYLGFSLRLPERHEALLAMRSSTDEMLGAIQVNCIGVIDETYCGSKDEWRQRFRAWTDGVIVRYDRIGQFRIIESMPAVSFNPVVTMEGPDRGGFGEATGRR